METPARFLLAAVSGQGGAFMTEPELSGRRMCAVSTGANGVVSSDTILVFEQTGNVVSARYRGGTVVDGYLIGLRHAATLQFRYVQADVHGNLDAGVSTGTIERLPDGRLRLIEQFQWLTRPGRGTNIFEEILYDNRVDLGR
jgi:hypothetical protein